MSNKTLQEPKQTKDDLRRMLAEAVLNTPGASRLEQVHEAAAERKPTKASAPKHAVKKRAGASSSRKSRRSRT